MDLKVSFDSKGLKIWDFVISPLDGTLKERVIDEVEYETLEKKNIRLIIEKVTPTIENGILKELVCEASDLTIKEPKDLLKEISEPSIQEKVLIFDGKEIPWFVFNGILEETGRWLVENEQITTKDIPIPVPRGRKTRTGRKTLLINRQPNNGSEEDPFVNWGLIGKGIYINKNFPGIYCKEHSEYLMAKFAPKIKYEIKGFDKVKGG